VADPEGGGPGWRGNEDVCACSCVGAVDRREGGGCGEEYTWEGDALASCTRHDRDSIGSTAQVPRIIKTHLEYKRSRVADPLGGERNHWSHFVRDERTNALHRAVGTMAAVEVAADSLIR
jgi:hypothetical protein